MIRDRTGVCGLRSSYPTASCSYQAAISEYLPDARHVLDLFHVARVRYEAFCSRVRVRDPFRWAVTAVR